MKKIEKYWELQKLYSIKSDLVFKFHNIFDLVSSPIIQKRFDCLELWQKDLLLTMFQSIEPFDNEPAKYGAGNLKRYEETYGEFNHDAVVRKEIKELINRGACINKHYLNKLNVYKEKGYIIDRLEDLYNLCVKPIDMIVHSDNGELKEYNIENNSKNRFITGYYYNLRGQIKGFDDHLYDDIEELYDWFSNNSELSKNDYMNVAKYYKINIEREEKYWMSDVKHCAQIEKVFKECKDKEESIRQGLIEIEALKQKLKVGEQVYYTEKRRLIGGEDEESIRNYVDTINKELDYSLYIKGRDKKLTEELLNNIEM